MFWVNSAELESIARTGSAGGPIWIEPASQ
jgi:hypothetical protein